MTDYLCFDLSNKQNTTNVMSYLEKSRKGELTQYYDEFAYYYFSKGSGLARVNVKSNKLEALNLDNKIISDIKLILNGK